MAAVKDSKESASEQGKLDFLTSAYEGNPKDQSDLPWYRSYPSAAVRGVATGIKNISQGMSEPYGLVDKDFKELSPFEAQKKFSELKQEQSKDFSGLKEKYLPIGSNVGPRALERGVTSAVESAPLALITGGPGSVVNTGIRSLIGGVGAEGIKDLGAPDWAQTGFEIGTQLAPGFGKAIPNRMLTQAGQEERTLIEGASRLGMNPEEYALTLNQRGSVKDFIQNISAKGGRLVDRFHNTKSALGRVWNTLRNTPEAQTSLIGTESSKLVNGISNDLSKLPAAQRDLVNKDFQDLIGSNMKGTDLMDFWQKLNYYIAKGENGLGIVKEHIQNAMNSISPQLGQDFQLTNKLYGNYHRLAERMGPNVAESLIRAGENGIVLTAVTTGNFPLLNKILAPIAARQLATELTSNPRFMNLSSRMINSFERGSPQVAKKVYDQMILEVAKTNAEAAAKMTDMDWDKFFAELPSEKKQKDQK